MSDPAVSYTRRFSCQTAYISCTQEWVHFLPALWATLDAYITIVLATIASRASDVVIDAILLVMTWIKTYGIHKRASSMGGGTPLASLLLIDGESYHQMSQSSLTHSAQAPSTSCELLSLNRQVSCRLTGPCVHSIIAVFQLIAVVTDSIDSLAENLNAAALHQVASIMVDFVPTCAQSSLCMLLPC